MIDDPSTPPPPIWGVTEIPLGGRARLDLGPLSLHVLNLPREWRVYSMHTRDPLSTAAALSVVADGGPPEGDRWSVVRFAQTREEGAILLSPRLADRAVVARPEVPISLVGGDDITLYVSTPIWACLRTARSARALAEYACIRPSDTWFGPTPRQGELCYATRTTARLAVDEGPRSPARALTRITLHNRATAPVHIERISIPIPMLSLYADASGGFWTNPIVFERLAPDPSGSSDGRLRIQEGPPDEATGASQPVAEPRRPVRSNVLGRALDAVLG